MLGETNKPIRYQETHEHLFIFAFNRRFFVTEGSSFGKLPRRWIHLSEMSEEIADGDERLDGIFYHQQSSPQTMSQEKGQMAEPWEEQQLVFLNNLTRETAEMGALSQTSQDFKHHSFLITQVSATLHRQRRIHNYPTPSSIKSQPLTLHIACLSLKLSCLFMCMFITHLSTGI
ncbi:BEN domain-containing protein 7-like [Pongo pygmaeus]|uniref:BEN domain-containing protein 7-like n=1 Tax=Pongo pygmaeus TaxID=9600 RepID=UPI0023E2322C|nr:BEN domain-containing protein 7-like [Pongo pygmaeus]